MSSSFKQFKASEVKVKTESEPPEIILNIVGIVKNSISMMSIAFSLDSKKKIR